MTGQSIAITDLTPNPKNPRAAWKPEQVEAFRASLRRFGDLGGIIRNLTTGQLVGGHKRVEVFKATPNVEVHKVDQEPDAQGTVAHGFVLVDGTRFAYREVRWPVDVETAANLAANRWAADWEYALVAEQLQSLQASDSDLLQLTGFPQHELDNLLAADWNPAARGDLADTSGDDDDAPSGHPHTIHLTDEQFAILQQAKERIAAGDDQTENPAPLSNGRVIELVCADFLAGPSPEGEDA